MSYTQLEGVIKFGSPLVDYGAQIHALRIVRARELVSEKPTFALAEVGDVAGPSRATLTIMFKSSTAAASFWAELWDAIDTDSAELPFEATLNAATVSADNPKFAGTIVVAGLETGGDVGAGREQSQTFPIKVGTLTKTTSP